ncbi:solute carrier family 23 member 2-like [Haliotis rufescens]|uniref:solute carrier family 23 member 2-like n=1 Tax=Haliotis rufescens TaxID=6454 RepID=UPI00201FAFAD|nr:solute carrier family 23 member 2-like [Haliotis rufescens]
METLEDCETQDKSIVRSSTDEIFDEDKALNEDGEEDGSTQDEKLQYNLIQVPPAPIMISAALQHVLLSLSSCLATSFIVSDVLCAAADSPLRTRLFSSTLFLCGICTILQTLVGIRLPIFQGPSSSFLPALLAIQNNAEWSCDHVSNGDTNTYDENNSTISPLNMTETSSLLGLTEIEKLQKLSGSLMAASFVEILVGSTGLVGAMLRYIGPVTVAPTISLIGLSLYKIPIIYSRPSWEISIAAAVLVLVFTLFLDNVRLPLPTCGKKKPKKGKRNGVRLFGLLPILLSIVLMWMVCAVLTVTNVFPDDPSSLRYMARTDSKSSLLFLTPWFIFPYPGQFGMPGFSVAVFIGFSAAFFSSLVESVGDYFAGSKACEVDTPPDHAVNRGILMEGLGGLLSGSIGVGHATTSYSGNIATISVSKTGSRSVMVCAGMMLIIFAILGKFGAGLASIPNPALGGVLIPTLGMLVSLGLSTLRYINLTSTRNLTILGTSMFVGMFVPEWINLHPDFINTGNPEGNAILKVICGTPMFLGGMIAVILDNTVKGSIEDRGIAKWRERHGADSSTQEGGAISSSVAYGWTCIPSLYKRLNILSYLPFMPPNSETHNLKYTLDKDHVII